VLCSEWSAASPEEDGQWSDFSDDVLDGDDDAAGGSVRWGDEDFNDDSTDAKGPNAAGSWGDGRWGDEEAGTWDESGSNGWGEAAADSPSWLSPAAAPSPAPPLREVETTKVGIIETPFARRNGIFAEVTVQHKDAPPTVTIVQFAKEVLMDVAESRDRDWLEVGNEPFAEAVVTYMRDVVGVDFTDEDWGLDREDVPFTSQHVSVRRLMGFCPDLLEHLADTLLPPGSVAETSAAEAATAVEA